jgi:crotonobetainyl-CoA:carnitine CoA-transferase CaiB-like acyl-CoA transferase
VGEAEPGVTSPLPLAGFRILSAEQYGAAPYGTLFLAQLGAEVIKIEPPHGGDTARQVGPHFFKDGESLYFQTFNAGKRSLTLDLRKPQGQAVLHRLAQGAHALANNLRGDIPAKLGLDYAALSPHNPAIVCAHLSSYGRDNPRAAWPGYDYLMQAEAGFLSLTGEPDAPPTRFGLSIVDFMTGAQMAVGLLAALLQAGRTGTGCDVDVDLLSVAIHQTSYPAIWYLNEGDAVGRAPRSAHPSVTPSQLFRAADGWVFVMAQLPKFWEVLTQLLGRADLAADARFADYDARLANRDALTAELDAVFGAQPVAHWLARLQGKVPVAPVHSLAQALDADVFRDTGMVAQVDHPARAGLRVLANPIKVDGRRLPVAPAPFLGDDTDAVLGEAGYSPDEVANLREAGIV